MRHLALMHTKPRPWPGLYASWHAVSHTESQYASGALARDTLCCCRLLIVTTLTGPHQS
jgi:hypothetical protein